MLAFTQASYPAYKAGWVHEDICARLEAFSEAVARGESPRLMLFIPPRHGKSFIVSERFPVWHLGKHPEHQFVVTSYGQALSNKFSKRARSLARDPDLMGSFPAFGLDPEKQAIEEWATSEGGCYKAVGVGGGLTGSGAHILVIDDPVKDQEQADSETYREAVKDWYTSTAYTRLMPGGGVLVVMTRWHEDDLAGWLLEEEKNGGDKWEVIRYPAIAEEDEPHRKAGEALHPDRYPLPKLKQIEKAVGPRVWSALYQQRPSPAEGSMFKKTWFTIVDAAPADAIRVRYWDKAGTAGGGAFTAGVAMSRTPQGIYYIEDVQRGQWSSGDREATIKQTADMDALKHGQFGFTVWVEQEPGSGGKESAENTIRNLDGYSAFAERVTGDKATRAGPLAAQAQVGNVRIVRGAWNQAFLDELATFPLGKFKDQVDATSGAFNKLAGNFDPAAMLDALGSL